jgi:hypothetical protein
MLGDDVREEDLEISQIGKPSTSGFEKFSAALLDLEIVFVLAVGVGIAVRTFFVRIRGSSIIAAGVLLIL